ncbi:MAG: ketol-acid reductoisomerase [Candidatus Omnitrophica bacterium]|nr:ketol-acid reductoisomerase [Candidatus Omnitrophota bacterium]
MANIYYEKDADLKALKGKTVAVIGYGIQGRGQSLNLRDSGVKVIVAQRPGGPNFDLAKHDGFTPMSVAEATKKADLIIVLAQDMLQGQIYKESIEPNLKAGKALGFSHGFAILYGLIKPPKSVDVVMIAPKGPGSLVRSQYQEGKGVPALIAVHQNATGQAKAIALAWAKGIGATRAGVLETTFKEETETDNFGEQAVLCGGASALIKAGFETLVEAGYQPEVAYFECLHELKLITDMFWASGIQGMRKRVSDTAKWGDIHCGPRVIDAHVKETMKQLLKEIQSGQFAKEWVAEHEAGRPNFTRLMQQDEQHLIEQVGAKLRAMMPWIGSSTKQSAVSSQQKAVGRSKNQKRTALRQTAKSRS